MGDAVSSRDGYQAADFSMIALWGWKLTPAILAELCAWRNGPAQHRGGIRFLVVQ
jgi:hypothetical protein